MIKLNETKMEATPRPWRISGCRSHNVTTGVGELMIEHGTEDEFSPILASLFSDSGRLPMRANAALIVSAVNQHDALLQVVEAAKLAQVRLFILDGRNEEYMAIEKALAALDKLKDSNGN